MILWNRVRFVLVFAGLLLAAQGLHAQTPVPECPGDDPVEGPLWDIADGSASGTVYVAGTGGVYRSCDGGDRWTSPSVISYSGLSLLIDPIDPARIYYGSDHGVRRSTDYGASFDATGGDITGLIFAFAAQSDGTLFAGGDNGVYASEDDGQTWMALDGDPRLVSVMALAVAPGNDQSIYAGTNGNGMFLSTDGGANWTAASNGNASWKVRDIEIDPANPSVIYAASLDGIWRSTDAGNTWADLGYSRVMDLDFDPNDDNRAYAASWDFGVLRSIDGGSSWSTVNAIFPTNKLYSLRVLQSGRVLVGTEFEGLYYSDDGGLSWGPAGAPIPPPAPAPPSANPYASLSVVVKNLSSDAVRAGEKARFRITVTNSGPDTSTDSTVNFSWVRNRLIGGNDPYPYTLTTSQGSCVRSVTATPDCTIGTLAAGASVEIEFRGETQAGALAMYILRVFTNNNESAGGLAAEVQIGSKITVAESGGGSLDLLALVVLGGLALLGYADIVRRSRR